MRRERTVVSTSYFLFEEPLSANHNTAKGQHRLTLEKCTGEMKGGRGYIIMIFIFIIIIT